MVCLCALLPVLLVNYNSIWVFFDLLVALVVTAVNELSYRFWSVLCTLFGSTYCLS